MRLVPVAAFLLTATVPVAQAQNRSSGPVAVIRSGPTSAIGRPISRCLGPPRTASGPPNRPTSSGRSGKADRAGVLLAGLHQELHRRNADPDRAVRNALRGGGSRGRDQHRSSRDAGQVCGAARHSVPASDDAGQKVAKKYGTSDESGFIRRSIYVIDPAGKVSYRNMHFDPFDPKAYTALGAAVRSVNRKAPAPTPPAR